VPRAARVLSTLCRHLVDELGASACAVSRVVGELLVQVTEHTLDGRTLMVGQGGYLIPDYPLTARVLEQGEPVALSLADPDPDPDEAALLAELGFESLLMVRLALGGKPWALVEVYGDGGRRFEAADVERAEALVATAASELASREP
jgi:GAF domain-containing protein